jgi:hypothetical protein
MFGGGPAQTSDKGELSDGEPLASLRQQKLRIDKVENTAVPPNTERTLSDRNGPGVVSSLCMALGAAPIQRWTPGCGCTTTAHRTPRSTSTWERCSPPTGEPAAPTPASVGHRQRRAGRVGGPVGGPAHVCRRRGVRWGLALRLTLYLSPDAAGLPLTIVPGQRRSGHRGDLAQAGSALS